MAGGSIDLPRFKEIKAPVDQRDFTWLRMLTDALVLVGDDLVNATLLAIPAAILAGAAGATGRRHFHDADVARMLTEQRLAVAPVLDAAQHAAVAERGYMAQDLTDLLEGLRR